MQSGRTQKIGFTAECRTLGAETPRAGVCVSHSDSMVGDFRVPFKSNYEGRRETQQAGLRGTKIPCIQAPCNTHYFSFCNQLVATTSDARFGRLKIIFHSPKKAGGEMETLALFAPSPST